MMRSNNFKVSVIVPLYNEEGCVSLSVDRIRNVLRKFFDYEILYIDDGSTDNTLQMLKMANAQDSKIKYISFSRNFGHQNALRAGTKYGDGDCIISMDGDMQHPPELIPELIAKWEEGYDIVYTRRTDTNEMPLAKRISSKVYYRLLTALTDINFEFGEADFRLIDSNVASELNNLQEDAIFYRGMVKWLGFKQIGIDYTPESRIWGTTRYSNRKMFGLALSGITGFSIKPLRISAIIGFTIALLSLIYGLYALYVKLFTDNSIEGWASVFFMVTFIGGIQLIMIGILGEYLGKTFIEVKKRPHYIIKEKSFDRENEKSK